MNRKKAKSNKHIIALLCVLITAVVILVAIKLISGNSDSSKKTDGTKVSQSTQQTQSASTTPDLTSIQNSVTSTQSQSDSLIQNIVTSGTDTNAQTSAVIQEQKISESGRIIVDPTTENWNLVVVNTGREIPKGYKPKLEQILDTGKYLDYRVAPFYEKMYLAAKKDGITLTPYSTYRSYELQERNYNNLTNEYAVKYGLSKKDAAKKAATVILPPGTSEHNLGLAIDVCNTLDSFANGVEYAWLQKHAHEYGFILRYTAEKQPITGIVPEPWHWRYVGVEYAKKIKDSGLCLEEYLDSVGIKY